MRDKKRAVVHSLKWAAAHPERQKLYVAKWQKKNAQRRKESDALRRARKKLATPFWANTFFIKEAKHLASLRTKMTGIKWHIDHIVPITHSLVCGLNVEANIAVIPAAWNGSKHNRFWPDMP